MSDYNFPNELRYTDADEWVGTAAGPARVGVTDYAQDQLGDVVFVELPEVGSSVSQGDSFGVIESVKAVSDLYAPISGTIVEVNSDLDEKPELVNEDCYGAGWIVAIEPSAADELDALMDAAAYAQSVSERSD